MTLQEWEVSIEPELPEQCPACEVGLPIVQFAEDEEQSLKYGFALTQNVFKAECPQCNHVLHRHVHKSRTGFVQ